MTFLTNGPLIHVDCYPLPSIVSYNPPPTHTHVVNDFDTTELEVLIPTSTGPINEVGVVVIVEDDLRDEVTDEGFLVLIELKDAMFPDLVQFDPVKRLTLARVLDNDGT